MHISVFSMIVMLSAYHLSLRLSGVLEVDTSVSLRCSTIVGGVLSVKFVWLGPDDREQTYPGLWFLPVWHEGIPDSMLLLLDLLVPLSRRSLLYSLAFVGLAVGVSIVFLEFSATFFLDPFPCTS